MNKFIKAIFLLFSAALLVYLTVPEPTSIKEFEALPGSVASKLSGDTVEHPQIVAYFSDNYREFTTALYYENYRQMVKLPFKPLRLNYPPQEAFVKIKDQTQSTYLEGVSYPLRGTLYINGMEPFEEDGTARFIGATPFEQDAELYQTKVTLRYYPAPLWARLVSWVGIVVSLYLIGITGRKVLVHD